MSIDQSCVVAKKLAIGSLSKNAKSLIKIIKKKVGLVQNLAAHQADLIVD